ncbi:hypothetical protein [Sediminibacterium sp.]|uniref:hypothetical protein n=1 Tax=Sediminibacterium sp. TaxID=1917865 RepID=UPI0025EC4479|nr:hypothetical protein [Sediminibacterium sp.]
MKVFYKTEYLEQSVSEDVELDPNLRDLVRANLDLANKYKISIMETAKWKTMWLLRSLEKEINQESGTIYISDKAPFEFVGFSEELLEKMQGLLGFYR